MTGDGLVFFGPSIFGWSVGRVELDAAGVERAVLCPAKPRGYHFGPANDQVAEAVRGDRDRFAGLVRIDPLLGDDAVAETERGLDELGLGGIFLHPWEETFGVADPRVADVVEVARARGVPVVVAAGYPWVSEGLQVGELASRFPDVAFVATNGLQINMSGLGQTDAELALADNDNIAIHTTGVYREDFLERVVARHGADRVLYASAFPHFDPRLEVRRVQWAAFSDEQKEAMLGGNADRLFSGVG